MPHHIKIVPHHLNGLFGSIEREGRGREGRGGEEL
jgi:hypothetical protein